MAAATSALWLLRSNRTAFFHAGMPRSGWSQSAPRRTRSHAGEATVHSHVEAQRRSGLTVHFLDPEGARLSVRTALLGQSLVDVAKQHGVGIHAACGQQLQCATCHVILKKAFYERLPRPGVRETDMLETAYSQTETSRLGCQVLLTAEMHGLEVMLPSKATKGLVRMTTDQPRPKVQAVWSSIPAVVPPFVVQGQKRQLQLGAAGEGALVEISSEWERLYHEQRARAALLEQQLQDHRAERSAGPKSYSGKTETRSQAFTTGGADSEEKDDLQKLKVELERTIVRIDRLGAPCFDEVVGLEDAKRVLRESILWPALGPPELFRGIRGRSRGVLLYGPPGCGKTMLARAAAAELCGSDLESGADETSSATTFFHVRPSDIMSKFYGDSQKRILALEELVKDRSPAIVFLDEVDTLLGKRDGGNGGAEHHKAVTNSLLTWMDGFDRAADRVFFIGATNRARAIDEAALRRFGDLVEVGLPDLDQRRDLLESLVAGARRDGHRAHVSPGELAEIAKQTEGMSGDDIARLSQQAFLEVLRELPGGVHRMLKLEMVPPVLLAHFKVALKRRVRCSGEVYKNLQQHGRAQPTV